MTAARIDRRTFLATAGLAPFAARALGAGRALVIRSVVLPSALPAILTGARISMAFAWGSIIAAELAMGIKLNEHIEADGRDGALGVDVVPGAGDRARQVERVPPRQRVPAGLCEVAVARAEAVDVPTGLADRHRNAQRERRRHPVIDAAGKAAGRCREVVAARRRIAVDAVLPAVG